MNFIMRRLNRDNFWNLVFWVGATGGCFAASIFKSSAIFWISAFLLRFIVKKGTKVSFTENRYLVNNRGEILNHRVPNGFIVASTPLAGTILLRYCLDSYIYNLSNNTIELLTISTFFFIPTMYFIIKNCPIAILFHFQAWVKGVQRDIDINP